tara:strand:+ start:290 stop:2062 length:1773 start_codon:yes stop_codon:yes gene_type:complete
MQISIANAIQVARLLGNSIIRLGLKMWLDFNKSEVIGSELVVNGDFATDLSGWIISNDDATHSVTWVGGAARYVSDTTSPQLNLDQTINAVIGAEYQVSINVTYTTGSLKIASIDGNQTILNEGLNVFNIVAASNTLRILRGGADVDALINSASIKEVTQFVKDKSPNTNNAKLLTGKALSFDGLNDYIDSGNIGISLKTLCFWINLGSSNEKVLELSSTQSVEVTSGKVVLNGTWDNSAVYVNNSATTNIINSVWQRVVITTTTAITVDNFQLGRIDSQRTNGEYILSDLQIYDVAWAQADVTFDYNNPNHLAIDNPATSLVVADLNGYYALSEGDGLVAYDSSGEGNNGTITGATYDDQQPTIPQLGMMDWAKSTPVADEITLIQAPNNKGFDILGNSLRLREHAFNLDGSGYAEVADDATLDFGTGEFSMEAWVKAAFVSQGSSVNVILTLGGDVTSTTTAALCSFNGNKLGAYINNNAIDIDTAFTVGQWYHVVLTRSSIGLCELYIDAQKQVDTETTTGTVSNASSKLIGKDSSINRGYDDLIDDTRLYNRALTQKEITQNYKAGLPSHKNGSSYSDDYSSDYGF